MAVFREGTNRVWGVFVLIYVAAALAVDLYWLFTESGPVATLASWQARHLGGNWYPKLTLMGLLLGELAAMLLVKVVIELITKKSLTKPLIKR